jgi:hypothetical protein
MKPNHRLVVSLAFASICLAVIATAPAARAEMNSNGVEVITNGPQVSPGDRTQERSGSQNRRDSERYESVVHSNANYRSERERRECGPITDSRMHEHCMASFGR